MLGARCSPISTTFATRPWTEWQDHRGDGCPLRPWQIIQYRYQKAGGEIETLVLYMPPKALDHPSWWWCNYGKIVHWDGDTGLCGKVLAFRIRKPRALQQLREMIETLPAPSRQKEGA